MSINVKEVVSSLKGRLLNREINRRNSIINRMMLVVSDKGNNILKGENDAEFKKLRTELAYKYYCVYNKDFGKMLGDMRNDLCNANVNIKKLGGE